MKYKWETQKDSMENWELNFKWLRLQHFIRDKFKMEVLPNIDTVLFLTGIQKLGKIQDDYSKEDKLSITTLGMCEILKQEGYFEETGIDDEGWPVWKELKPFEPESDIKGQEILKINAIDYFERYYDLKEFNDDV